MAGTAAPAIGIAGLAQTHSKVSRRLVKAYVIVVDTFRSAACGSGMNGVDEYHIRLNRSRTPVASIPPLGNSWHRCSEISETHEYTPDLSSASGIQLVTKRELSTSCRSLYCC
jgi:hypothetical protein